jgi:hypothetical protein
LVSKKDLLSPFERHPLVSRGNPDPGAFLKATLTLVKKEVVLEEADTRVKEAAGI